MHTCISSIFSYTENTTPPSVIPSNNHAVLTSTPAPPTGERYDTTYDMWVTKADILQPRGNAAMFLLEGNMYIAGGDVG